MQLDSRRVDNRPMHWPWRGVAILAAIAVLAIQQLVANRPLKDPDAVGVPRPANPVAPGPVPRREVFLAEGLSTPPTVPAEEAMVGDDEPVIGVEAGGKARAYRLRAMRLPTRHVINDVVGGIAVTITYCDLNRCIRGFGGALRAKPLQVSQAGLIDDQMVVKVGGVGYSQESGAVVEHDPGSRPVPFPFTEYPLTRTTWKQWKAQHPQSDIYMGDDVPGARRSR